MIIRLTQKLAKKLKVTALPEMPLDDNPLADWSAQLFTVGRTQHIFLCHTKSFYSFLMPKRGITNERRLIDAVWSGIQETMEEDGLGDAYQSRILPESNNVQFAKAFSRSTTSSMNRLVQLAEWLLVEYEMPVPEVRARLNDDLMSALAWAGSRDYGTPEDAMKLLLREEGLLD